MPASKGASGSAVLSEPFQHLIQHIKQGDPMLYEALRKISRGLTDNSTNIENITTNPPETIVSQDKVTFGLVKTLVVGTGLTLDYICRKAGKFVDFAAKVTTQIPTGSDAVLDVLKSMDDGTTWNSIFPTTGRITLPNGGSATILVTQFALAGITVGDLLRIDCLQIGSTNPGKGIEVVGRFTAT